MILEQFYAKYGSEDYSYDRKPYTDLDRDKIDRQWTWEGPESSLVFTSKYVSFSIGGIMPDEFSGFLTDDSVLIIENTWNEHERLMEQYKEEANRQQQLKEQEEARRQALERRQEMEKLKKMQSDLGDDL